MKGNFSGFYSQLQQWVKDGEADSHLDQITIFLHYLLQLLQESLMPSLMAETERKELD